MKKLAIVTLLWTASLAAADYSGIWNGKGAVQSARYPGGIPYTVQMTLLQAGTSLKGTLKVGNNTPFPISSGTVSGTALTFSARTGPTQVTAQLSVTGAQLTGRMTLSDGTVYSVVFTKR